MTTESTPKTDSERLRMALRLRLSLREAGKGCQGETILISPRPPVPRTTEPDPATEASSTGQRTGTTGTRSCWSATRGLTQGL